MPENPRPLPPGIGEMTLKDLIAKLGGLSQPALWLMVLFLLFRSSGCELPEVKFPDQGRKPPRLIPRADPVAAIGRISMGNVGCTATIIGPIDDDDKEIAILTAAHCIKQGQSGTMVLKDGRKFSFKCVSRDAASDAAWLVAPRPEGAVPFALLAKGPPEKGAAVWHQGYGVDKPGNLEKGTYQGVSSDGRQLVFHLSVSSGDSGGGIIATEAGEVLSPVCCTQRLSGPGQVWGATPMASAAIRPGNVAEVSEEERYNPVIILPHPGWPEPPAG